MNYKQTFSFVVLIITVCICSVSCASRSARMGGRDGNLLDQASETLKSAERSDVSIKVKGWGDLEPLSSELEKRGYKIVEKFPTYKIEGDSKLVLGPYIGPAIAWDVLMAVPSVFLPVPIIGSYAWKLDVTISDGANGNVLSEIEETVNYRVIGYSLWGFIFGVPGNVQKDLLAITALLTDEKLNKIAK